MCGVKVSVILRSSCERQQEIGQILRGWFCEGEQIHSHQQDLKTMCISEISAFLALPLCVSQNAKICCSKEAYSTII